MVDSVTCTILADDAAGVEGIRAEHGLAFWIEADGFRVLFDTGQGGVLADNARALGINLGSADAVAISHGHYDHTGGLPAVLPEARNAEICLHPDAMRSRFSRSSDGKVRPIGMPLPAAERLRERSGAVRWTRTATFLHPGIFLTGEVPRREPPEASTSRFFLDQECTLPDPFLDDQALVVETDAGAIIFLGCSHAGVGNTLSHALTLSRTGKLRALLGGMHLANAPQERVEGLARRLGLLAPRFVGPCHCTGQEAEALLEKSLPGTCRVARGGLTISSGGSF